MSIARYVRPAEFIEAAQFLDRHSGTEICDWLEGGIYIAQGQESAYRAYEDSEDMPPFLLIHTASDILRMDLSDWVVKTKENQILVMDELLFSYTFEEQAHEQPC